MSENQQRKRFFAHGRHTDKGKFLDATQSFQSAARTWWLIHCDKVEAKRLPEISTWSSLKSLMYKRFVLKYEVIETRADFVMRHTLLREFLSRLVLPDLILILILLGLIPTLTILSMTPSAYFVIPFPNLLLDLCQQIHRISLTSHDKNVGV